MFGKSGRRLNTTISESSRSTIQLGDGSRKSCSFYGYRSPLHSIHPNLPNLPSLRRSAARLRALRVRRVRGVQRAHRVFRGDRMSYTLFSTFRPWYNSIRYNDVNLGCRLLFYGKLFSITRAEDHAIMRSVASLCLHRSVTSTPTGRHLISLVSWVQSPMHRSHALGTSNSEVDGCLSGRRQWLRRVE